MMMPSAGGACPQVWLRDRPHQPGRLRIKGGEGPAGGHLQALWLPSLRYVFTAATLPGLPCLHPCRAPADGTQQQPADMHVGELCMTGIPFLVICDPCGHMPFTTCPIAGSYKNGVIGDHIPPYKVPGCTASSAASHCGAVAAGMVVPHAYLPAHPHRGCCTRATRVQHPPCRVSILPPRTAMGSAVDVHRANGGAG